MVPDGTQVKLEWLADAAEPGTAGAVRFTRIADQSEIDANSLTVSFLTSGSATPGSGSDFVFSGASASTPTAGQPLTVTFAAGQNALDLSVQVNDDTNAEGWESVRIQLQEETGYTLGTTEPVTVWVADNEL